MDHAGRWWLLVQLTLALAPHEAQSTTFKITTPYSLYICPEGQSVTLTCKVSGSLADRHDAIFRLWYFSNKDDKSCSQKKHVHDATVKDSHHELGTHHGLSNSNNTAKKYSHGQRANNHGQTSSSQHGTFHINLANLTLQDSGLYCCYVIEAKKEHNKPHAKQQAHGFMELRQMVYWQTVHFILLPAQRVKMSQQLQLQQEPALWAFFACPSSCSLFTGRDKPSLTDVLMS